jgi:subtilisin-like proprotein convertase family protein
LSSSGLVALIALSLIAASLQSRSAASASPYDSSLPLMAAGDKMTNGQDTTDDVSTFSNPTSITITDRPSALPTSGAASLFPSPINVSGVIGTVTKVTVTLNAFSHTWPDDVDVLLVGPTGQTVFLMSDAGGSVDAFNVPLTFDDTASSQIPDIGMFTAGAYKPGDFEEERPLNGTDTFPETAPPPPYGTALSVFNGTNPNGVWKLFVADDENGESGSISGGWSLTITNSVVGNNAGAINLPDSGAASLYPSSVNVAGLSGLVVGVTVVLNNFSHAAPDDVDLLLVAPNGRSVVVMSDVGGATAVNNLTLVLEDSAGSSLPDNGPLTSGTFKPTNIGSGDNFPAPAPATAPTTLSALNGMTPNGVWSLYAVDDAGGNAGSINGGWSLALNTSLTACDLSLAPVGQAFPVTGGTGSFNILPAGAGCGWTATSNSGFVTIISNASGEGSGSVNFAVAANMGGGRTGTINISTANFTRTFTVQQESGCPFSLSQETLHFGRSGGAGNVGVTAAGACGWAATTKDSWITINSGNGAGNGTVALTVAANPSMSERTGTVTIGARTLTIMQDATGNEAVLDFDGDGKSDYAIVRPQGGVHTWHLQQSLNGSTSQQWGVSNSVPVPGDYDGDGKWDIAVWQSTPAPSVFYILRSQTHTLQSLEWGIATDDARSTQDFDGDDKADPTVTRYDASGLSWYIRESISGNLRAVQFGASSDVPVRGDFDGDGKADIAVYRRPTGSPANTFFVLRSSDGAIQAATFGNYNTDYVVPGDFDGDGRTDYAVWRGRGGGNGVWYWQRSSDNALGSQPFGIAGTDEPAPGDYDGDGRTDQAVWRKTASAVFYVNGSTSGFISVPWGIADDFSPAFTLQAR